MTILAIESSCDDTAAAVLDGAVIGNLKLLSNVVSSQLEHVEFGGVVPELASRAHQRLIVPVVEEALVKARVSRKNIDAIAVTYGPGLAGSLLVGLSFAKAMALALDVPLIGINHLEGHMYSVFLEEEKPPVPFLSLTVSGGHTQLVTVEPNFKHTILGKTRDDAAGEAFDKVAKMFGLPYPGGPEIDKLAKLGDPTFVDFPRSKVAGFDFSFSGLKTSVLYYLNKFTDEEREQLFKDHLPDLCASFQASVVDSLIWGIRRAVRKTGLKHVAIAGGVSANSGLRIAAQKLAEKERFTLYVPSPKFSVDNAAMIAITAHFKLSAGITSPLSLTAEPALRV